MERVFDCFILLSLYLSFSLVFQGLVSSLSALERKVISGCCIRALPSGAIGRFCSLH